MNILFIHHKPDIHSEVVNYLVSPMDTCFFSRNTTETIKVLGDHQVDLVIMIITNIRDAAVLKYINDNHSELEVLLVADEEYDEIITLFCDSQYTICRLPLELKLLLTRSDTAPAARLAQDKTGDIESQQVLKT
ncbi:MAG: hypothetical protein WCJ26_09265 [bacterium]